MAVQPDDAVVAANGVRELKLHAPDLERLLGSDMLEVDVLKEALAVARSVAPVPG